MLTTYNLPGQMPNEKVIKIIHRNFFVVVKRLLFFVLMGLVPVLFVFIANLTSPEWLTGPISYPIIILGLSAYLAFTILLMFSSLIDHFLDIWIITSERIIDMQQKGFFSRTISEQRLENIQDVTSEMKGLWPTLFRYGNVYVQSAGAQNRFCFSEVSQPEEIRDIIIKLAEGSKTKVQVS